MGLFTKAKNESAFLKASFMGFAKAGKTFTSSEVAIGLVLHCRKLGLPYASKPVFFLDSEKGSDWTIPRFERAGIELYSAKTRAFSDLCTSIKEGERDASLLLVDSLTKFWVEFCDSYKVKRDRKRGLEFQDWSFLKERWQSEFVEPFLGSNLHIILCGRAGFEFEHYEDEAGKKQIEKSGIKMKAESETGFEADLLVYMERETDLHESKMTRVANIFGDRANVIDGKRFVNPTFKNFLPHINSLALGAAHRGIDTSRTSKDMIPEERLSRDSFALQREIVLDEIEAAMVERHPGQSAADKSAKAALLKQFFIRVGTEEHTTSWSEVEKDYKTFPLAQLQMCYDRLYRHLNNNEPSRYTAAKPVIVQQTPVEEDAIPEFGGDVEKAVAALAPEDAVKIAASLKEEAEPEPEPAKGKAVEALAGTKRVRVQAGSQRVPEAGTPSQSANAKSDFTAALDMAMGKLRGAMEKGAA